MHNALPHRIMRVRRENPATQGEVGRLVRAFCLGSDVFVTHFLRTEINIDNTRSGRSKAAVAPQASVGKPSGCLPTRVTFHLVEMRQLV